MNQDFQRTLVVVAIIFVALLGTSYGVAMASGSGIGTFGIVLVSGLFNAMLLFLVAAGLSIVFGLMDVLNLAQGAYFTIGAYVAWQFHHAPALAFIQPDLRFVLGVLLATAIGAILGVILERGLLQPLYERPIFQIVLTFGVGIVIGEILKAIWGVAAKQWVLPFSLQQGFFNVFGQQFSIYRLFVIIIGAILIVAIAILLRNTRIGIIIRAGVEDDEMVEALGINVRLVFTSVFTLGCAVASFGGAVAAPFLGAGLGIGQGFLLGAIAVIVLGGLGSYEGTAIASVLVGLAVQVVIQVSNYLGTINFDPAVFMDGNAAFLANMLNGITGTLGQTVWSSMTPMILLVLVLLLRPSGLFGKER
ncbi:MAG: branched-chain amino acid ABC transporter permease [Chloroflexota bacterium]